ADLPDLDADADARGRDALPDPRRRHAGQPADGRRDHGAAADRGRVLHRAEVLHPGHRTDRHQGLRSSDMASCETELAGLWRALTVNEAATQRVFDSVVEGTTPDEMQEIFVAECWRRGIDGRISGAAFVVGEDGAGPKLRTKQPLKPGDLFGMD